MGQPRNRGFRQAGAFREIRVGQRHFTVTVALQYRQPTRQRGDKIAVLVRIKFVQIVHLTLPPL